MLKQRLPRQKIDVAALRSSIDQRSLRLAQATRRSLDLSRSRLDTQRQAISLLNPVRVLERGYSIVEHDGAIVRDASQVSAGDRLRVQLARGVIEAEVKSNQ
jgi:exodeoxyribonuclease VII large subunit